MARFDKTLKVRADDRIIEWVKQLADEAGRTPSAYLRDLIFYLRITNAGGIIGSFIQERGIHYKPMPSAKDPPPIEKPIFPWQTLKPPSHRNKEQ
jgi:hypothetical protein